MPIRAKSTRVLLWWRNDVLEYFLSLCKKAFLHFSYWSRKLQQIMARLLPRLIFPGNWANARGFLFFVFLFNVTILKAAERWKVRFEYNAFLFHQQAARPGTPLHYTHASEWMFPLPRIIFCVSVQGGFWGTEGHTCGESLHTAFIFAVFISVTTCN